MYPAPFDYYRATSLADAIRLLGAHPDAKVLAGGHSLLPMLKLRLATPSALVDIGRLPELGDIRAEGATVRIGALATHHELATSPVMRRHCPLLAEVAGKIADPQVRNWGTVGGNIAHADPASDLGAALLALDAVVSLVGSGGERHVESRAFFLDLLTTDVRPGEVITAVTVKATAAGTGTAYLKFEHPASGYAVCGAAAVVTLGADGRCAGARLCFNGVTATPLDASGVSSALTGATIDETSIAAVMNAHLVIAEPLGDIHFSGEYRAALARTYGARALLLARDRARRP